MAFKVGNVYVEVRNDWVYDIDRWGTTMRSIRKGEFIGHLLREVDSVDPDVRDVRLEDLLPLEV